MARSRISGPGGLVKWGTGILELTGSSANIYQGLTRVSAGQVRLNKSAGTLAIPGDLEIGDGTAANEDVVRLLAPNRLRDDRTVSVGLSGWLDLNHRHEALGGLRLTGGRVSSGTGTLTLLGDVTTLSASRSARIEGRLFLGPGAHTFTTAAGNSTGPDLLISAAVSSDGLLPSFVKAGPGSLELSGNNSYHGLTRVAAGWLVVSSPTGLGVAESSYGLASGTSVHAGATLALLGVHLGDEQLGLAGSGAAGAGALNVQVGGSLSGPVSLESETVVSVGNLASSTFEFAGHTYGPGHLVKTGPGTLRMSGSQANTHTGGTTIRRGAVVLAKPAGVVALPGPVVIGDGVGAEPDSLWLETAGQLADNAAVQIASSGLLTIPAERNEVNLLLSANTTVGLELNGLTGNSQHDQLITLGTVNLGGARLELQLGFIPPAGSKFLLCLNDGADPIVGRFAGLPEGAAFSVNGVPLRITYLGGSGANDVVLEVTGQPVTSPAPSLRSPHPGAMELAAHGLPHQRYHLERSSDLKTWRLLASVQGDDRGDVRFQDPDSPAAAAFYRLIAEEEVAR